MRVRAYVVYDDAIRSVASTLDSLRIYIYICTLYLMYEPPAPATPVNLLRNTAINAFTGPTGRKSKRFAQNRFPSNDVLIVLTAVAAVSSSRARGRFTGQKLLRSHQFVHRDSYEVSATGPVRRRHVLYTVFTFPSRVVARTNV